MITSLSHRILLAWGWERQLIALFGGAVGALAMPPLDIMPALLVAFPIAIWLIDGSSTDGRRFSAAALFSAASAGWLWGFGYLVAGLWWLGSAFLVDAEQFLWAMPLGVLGLPAGLALFFALGFAFARLLWSEGPFRIFAFAASLSASEWLRGHIFTGFPWNSFGQAFGDYLIPAQAASIFGLDGLSLVALLVFSTPALIADEPFGRRRFRGVFLGAAVIALLFGFGAVRLALNGGFNPLIDAEHTVKDVKLRIMQPNISMFAKGDATSGQALLETYLSLSDKATSPGAVGILDATHVIWPESPFPFLLARQPQALKMIGAALKGKVTLITGAIRGESSGEEAGASSPGAVRARYYNAIQVVGPDSSIVQSYDKLHLVPFGEYLPIPFKWLIEGLGLRQFVHVPGGFEAGVIRRPLILPGLPPALPLICYEAIFPAEVTRTRTSEEFLLNVTNDAWFGETFGPYQHFAQARLRAVEQGLPLVRAANTGISAVIDPYGRIVRQLPVGVADVIDAPLPRAAPPTLYSRYGDGIYAVLFLLMMSMALASAIGGGMIRTR